MNLPHVIITSNEEPLRQAFIVVWKGTNPELPGILLNSHTDVVPVFEEYWKHPPFEAHKEENGDIYARGSQDMKSVGIQYMEAVRRLMATGRRLRRTIYICFVPDEEISGILGMKKLRHLREFKELNIGFVLDEGLANPTDAFTLFYGERSPWYVKVKCLGRPGHGSKFIEDNAAQKLRVVINKFLSFRDSEEARLKSDPTLRLGDVTTVNMTNIAGGIAHNIVPAELFAYFDIRIAQSVDLKEFHNRIEGWCQEAGPNVSCELLQSFYGDNLTELTEDNIWWKAFRTACEKMNMKLEKEIFPAATDSRYLRELGYSVFGFSPMNNTPILLHDHNEFLNENVFMKGIEIYENVIAALADVA